MGYPSYGYKYHIGHYQGKTENPLVIGDKFAGPNTNMFLKPEKLIEFMQVIDKPFKFKMEGTGKGFPISTRSTE